MTDPNAPIVTSSPLSKAVGWLIAAIALMGFLPILVLLIGTPFLPSMEWAAKSDWPGSLFGMAVGVVTAVFVLKRRDLNPKLADASVLKLSFTALGVAVMMWMMGFLTVMMSYPMITAWSAGEDTRLAYVVADPVSRGGRGCRQAVKLHDMPFMFDNLCGTPPDMQQALREGQTVYASGNGTDLGVFYDRFDW